MTSMAYPDDPARAVERGGPPALRRRVSWGAIFAGAILTVTVSLALNVLGIAIGTNMVDVAQGSTPSAASFGIGGGIWLLVSNLIALAVGAYAAAHLSGVTERGDAGLHGLSVWALSTLLAVLVLGSLTGGAVSTVGSGLSSVVGGAANGVGHLASAAGGQATQRTSTGTLQSTAQQLVDRAQSALTAPQGNPSGMTSDQRKAEIARLVGQRISGGNLSQQDSDRLAALVAAETGMSPDEAKARVQDVEHQAEQTVQQAKDQATRAADAAAHAASVGAYWAFGTLLLGAIVAALAAATGVRKPYVDQRYS